MGRQAIYLSLSCVNVLYPSDTVLVSTNGDLEGMLGFNVYSSFKEAEKWTLLSDYILSDWRRLCPSFLFHYI